MRGGSLSLINQLDSSTATDIHNAAHQVVTAVAAGATVHDFVTVTRQPGKPTPSGNVTFDLFLNGTCARCPGGDARANVALGAGGQVDATGFAVHGATRPGIRLPGDTIRATRRYTASVGACEPLRWWTRTSR